MEGGITLLACHCHFSCIAHTCTIKVVNVFKSSRCRNTDQPYIKQMILLTR